MSNVQGLGLRLVFVNDLLGKLLQFLDVIDFCRIEILREQIEGAQAADRLSLWDADARFHFWFLDQMKLESVLCIFA